jgi:hypothetical protein
MRTPLPFQKVYGGLNWNWSCAAAHEPVDVTGDYLTLPARICAANNI